MLEERQILLCL
jgi:hypothetical protein